VSNPRRGLNESLKMAATSIISSSKIVPVFLCTSFDCNASSNPPSNFQFNLVEDSKTYKVYTHFIFSYYEQEDAS
jgi:hypothetical protein